MKLRYFIPFSTNNSPAVWRSTCDVLTSYVQLSAEESNSKWNEEFAHAAATTSLCYSIVSLKIPP